MRTSFSALAAILSVLHFVAILPAAQQADSIDFSHAIVPILKQHCVECHGGSEAKGGFSLNTRGSFLEGGMAEPGDVTGSHFLQLVASTDVDSQMPPQGKPRVPPQQLAKLKAWVVQGMPWEEGFSFAPQQYEPPLRLRPPTLPPSREGLRHPLDRILEEYRLKRGLPRRRQVDDATFLRRVHLDLIGLLPDAERVTAFVADSSPDKRERMIDSLLANRIAYAEHWLTFWNDLFRNDYDGTGFITGGRKQISGWLYQSLLNNKAYDQMARELIAPPADTSRGFIDGIRWRGDVSAGQTVEIQFAQSVGQAFLGINLKCASCHDSFIDRWKLSDAYGLAAIYSTSSLEIHRCDKPTGRTAEASWLFPELGQVDPQADPKQRLQQLAELMTHRDNGRFSRTIANRMWHQLMGRGIVHPLDAMQSQPWDADLLDYLASYLVEQQYDLQQLLKLIATSQAYQAESFQSMEGDGEKYVFQGPEARRLTAEQFIDAVWQLTGSAPDHFDAPVVRGPANDGGANRLRAVWIWGDSVAKGGVPAAGEKLVFRRSFFLDKLPERSGVVVTCDNSFQLFVNARRVAAGDDWQRPQTAQLKGRLRPGTNTITVVAGNGGSGPNAAGLLLQADLHFDDETLTIATDDQWQVSGTVPSPTEDRLDSVHGPWQSAHVVPTLPAWAKAVHATFATQLARVEANEVLAVRASLLKATPLMRSLGRPNRDQIVSMRPRDLTTLEALDLANDASFNQALQRGARRLMQDDADDSRGLVRKLYLNALTREPTDAELETLRDFLGPRPALERVQDVLWTLCLSPEFLWVR